MKELDDFYFRQDEPNQSCFLALRQIILNIHPEMTATFKYGGPCFLYKRKMLVYLWRDKKQDIPYILFVDGGKIDHPLLIQGDRKRMKVFYVDPTKDLQVELIEELLGMAIEVKENS
ncbi:DUF1801 domain-containing protein [Sanyastnella coralliicola]|uniref:DUF1801 domain-containing protein n=1 Tax=Sanyastnella coralliicola TaxID=3069118 RepID=UPI0027BAD48C|nr:DUF1801 domain-containing protein [Longitalea sp. SCSIO 12813]